MISLKEVLAIHALLIKAFGGTPGVRDQQALEAAIARPYQSFEQQDLYPRPPDKAAAILESVVSNHPRFSTGINASAMRSCWQCLLQNVYDLVEEEVAIAKELEQIVEQPN